MCGSGEPDNPSTDRFCPPRGQSGEFYTPNPVHHAPRSRFRRGLTAWLGWARGCQLDWTVCRSTGSAPAIHRTRGRLQARAHYGPPDTSCPNWPPPGLGGSGPADTPVRSVTLVLAVGHGPDPTRRTAGRKRIERDLTNAPEPARTRWSGSVPPHQPDTAPAGHAQTCAGDAPTERLVSASGPPTIRTHRPDTTRTSHPHKRHKSRYFPVRGHHILSAVTDVLAGQT